MRTNRLAFYLLAALTSSLSVAGARVPQVPAGLKATLEQRYPDVKVVDVQPTPLAGLYEIYTGDQIVYASANGDYLLAGPLMDTRARRNLTADRMDERSSIDFSGLPLDLAIKSVKGDGSRKMAVFADPDCPFCQRLERELASVDNVTVYTFLFPITDLHPDAGRKAHTIWCSPDRVQAWTQWMREGTAASGSEECKSDPVEQLRALGITLHVGSTPTIFFANGRRVTSAIPVAEIESRLGTSANPPAAGGT